MIQTAKDEWFMFICFLFWVLFWVFWDTNCCSPQRSLYLSSPSVHYLMLLEAKSTNTSDFRKTRVAFFLITVSICCDDPRKVFTTNWTVTLDLWTVAVFWGMFCNSAVARVSGVMEYSWREAAVTWQGMCVQCAAWRQRVSNTQINVSVHAVVWVNPCFCSAQRA